MVSIINSLFTFTLIISISCAGAKWYHDHSEPEFHHKHKGGYSRIPNSIGTPTGPDIITTTTFTPWPSRETDAPRRTTPWPTPSYTTPRPTRGPFTTRDPFPTHGPITTHRPIPTPGFITDPIPGPNKKHYHHVKPEYEPVYTSRKEYKESPSLTKTCKMTCRSLNTKAKEWPIESFKRITGNGYTCRVQKWAKTIMDIEKYCDIYINALDKTTNQTMYYCTHASILSLASVKLHRDVTTALERHATNVDRDRSQLPSIEWPALPPIVIKSILEYIYTNRMTGADVGQHMVGLYVGAFYAELTELMDPIEHYLYQTFDAVQQLNEFVVYFRWAHITTNAVLKNNLKRIGRVILRMSEQQFEKFIDICKSSGYIKMP